MSGGWKVQSRHDGVIQMIGRDITNGTYDGYIADILDEDKKFSLGLPAEYYRST